MVEEELENWEEKLEDWRWEEGKKSSHEEEELNIPQQKQKITPEEEELNTPPQQKRIFNNRLVLEMAEGKWSSEINIDIP